MTCHAGRRHPGFTSVIVVALAAAGAPWSPAMGAAGDLDPAFGNVGRFGPATEFVGPAWSIEPHGDGGWILAGGVRRPGTFDAPRQYITRGYVGRLRIDGTVDDMFETRRSTTAYARDAAVQQDGRIVAVGLGRWAEGGTNAVWRFEATGAAGQGLLGEGLAGGAGNSVALHPDGRIVAAGSGAGGLKVWRLLPSGELDASFADAGVFVRAASPSRVSIVNGDDGGYRVLVLDASEVPARCSVLALTASGQLDEDYGESGIAAVRTAEGAEIACTFVTPGPAGSLLVAGAVDGRAVVVRLTADGRSDAGFDAADIADLMVEARAVGRDEAGKVIVAGRGADGTAGALVARLNPDGVLDTRFGRAGSTWIDLPNEGSGYAVVNDIHVAPGGAILVAGAGIETSFQTSGAPFVARLLGDEDAGSPGVVGCERPRIGTTEGAGQLALTVRRMGGRAGAISVAYRTRAAGGNVYPAEAGVDYTEVSGQLHWADGDAGDRQILIPIGPDGGAPEDEEVFQVELDTPTGGAGVGTRVGNVAIAADGAPAGSFSLRSLNDVVGEDTGTTQVAVSRNYYSTGAVSVSLKLESRTATAGQDFAADPLMLQWADGETGEKYVDVRILDDSARESAEQFTVMLVGATGGAVIGPRSSAIITIGENDSSPPPSSPPSSGGGGASSSGGGGALGWLSLLSLALACRRRIRIAGMPQDR